MEFQVRFRFNIIYNTIFTLNVLDCIILNYICHFACDSVHHSDGRDCPSFLQGQGAISPLPPSPRSTAAQLRHNKRPQLQKQATCSEHYYKSTPKLFHSASLEKFPGHSTWLKPSLSLGNFPPFKQRYHESFSGTGFSSAESLLEEPDQMIEDSVEVDKNYQGNSRFLMIIFVFKGLKARFNFKMSLFLNSRMWNGFKFS